LNGPNNILVHILAPFMKKQLPAIPTAQGHVPAVDTAL
jgi:hypothetical protein